MKKLLIGIVPFVLLIFVASAYASSHKTQFKHSSSFGKAYAQQYTNLKKTLKQIIRETGCRVKGSIKFRCAGREAGKKGLCKGSSAHSSSGIFLVKWGHKKGRTCKFGSHSKFVCTAKGFCRQLP